MSCRQRRQQRHLQRANVSLEGGCLGKGEIVPAATHMYLSKTSTAAEREVEDSGISTVDIKEAVRIAKSLSWPHSSCVLDGGGCGSARP